MAVLIRGFGHIQLTTGHRVAELKPNGPHTILQRLAMLLVVPIPKGLGNRQLVVSNLEKLSLLSATSPWLPSLTKLACGTAPICEQPPIIKVVPLLTSIARKQLFGAIRRKLSLLRFI